MQAQPERGSLPAGPIHKTVEDDVRSLIIRRPTRDQRLLTSSPTMFGQVNWRCVSPGGSPRPLGAPPGVCQARRHFANRSRCKSQFLGLELRQIHRLARVNLGHAVILLLGEVQPFGGGQRLRPRPVHSREAPV